MRRRSWGTWLAVRAILMSVAATVAAYILHSALPKLLAEAYGRDTHAVGIVSWLTRGDMLLIIPAPAFVLGVLALVLRPLRFPLAALAGLAALVAFVAVVGSLLGALIPLYQVPRDLMSG